MASAALWPSSAEELFLFCVCRGLRAAPSTFSQIRTNQQKCSFWSQPLREKNSSGKSADFPELQIKKYFSAKNGSAKRSHF